MPLFSFGHFRPLSAGFGHLSPANWQKLSLAVYLVILHVEQHIAQALFWVLGLRARMNLLSLLSL